MQIHADNKYRFYLRPFPHIYKCKCSTAMNIHTCIFEVYFSICTATAQLFTERQNYTSKPKAASLIIWLGGFFFCPLGPIASHTLLKSINQHFQDTSKVFIWTANFSFNIPIYSLWFPPISKDDWNSLVFISRFLSVFSLSDPHTPHLSVCWAIYQKIQISQI